MSEIPEFKDEKEEAEFSLRLDPDVISDLKKIAGQKGMGYQTLIRMWVMERLTSEIK